EEWLLPPFLGEMGVEIEFFLASVEPYLRSGWKIPARRPQLYPRGTAFYDEELFAKIDTLIKQYQAKAIVSRLMLPFPALGPINLSIENSEWKVELRINKEQQQAIIKIREFEKELKKIVGERILTPTRPITLWDDFLTTVHNPYNDPFGLSSLYALKPSYLPPDYSEGPDIYVDHIGVQLRRYREPNRNSDVAYVLKRAQEASMLLGKPILIYGHPNGTVHPEGYPTTLELSQKRTEPLLTTELKALRTCAIMFAPNSGWADLMAWLNVPTFVEKVECKNQFYRLRTYKTRMAELRADMSMEELVIDLFSARERLPDDSHCQEPFQWYQMPGAANPYFR
ncbi:MAG: hypothetical protein K6347_00120, partial [Campylobacterales bacterium]